jgi:hypothetical protein
LIFGHFTFPHLGASQHLFREQASAELAEDRTNDNARAHSMRCFSMFSTPSLKTEPDRHSDGGRTLHRIYTMPSGVPENFRLNQESHSCTHCITQIVVGNAVPETLRVPETLLPAGMLLHRPESRQNKKPDPKIGLRG